MFFAKDFEDDRKTVEERPGWFSIIFTEPVYVPPKRQSPKRVKYKLKKLVCSNCGTSFFFEGGEQHYFALHDLREPKCCRTCRKARKQNQKTTKTRRMEQ